MLGRLPHIEDIEDTIEPGSVVEPRIGAGSIAMDTPEFRENVEQWIKHFQSAVEAAKAGCMVGSRKNNKRVSVQRPVDWLRCIPDVQVVEANLTRIHKNAGRASASRQDPIRSATKHGKKFENEFGNFKRAVVNAVGFRLISVDDCKQVGGLMSAMDQKWDDLMRLFIERGLASSTLKTTLSHCESIWQRYDEFKISHMRTSSLACTYI